MEEKILTKEIVLQNGWNKLEIITADILDGYTEIGEDAFQNCENLISITIPNSVISIGGGAFYECSSLISVIIPNSVTSIRHRAFEFCFKLMSITIPNSVTSIGSYTFLGCGFKVEKRYDEQGRLIAYKGFNADMSCRDFKYEEGKIYEIDGEIELCKRGFHACTNPLDCLNHYWSKIGKDVVYHEVYLEGVSDETSYDSKVVASKITIGKEITLAEMTDIASGRK